MSIEKLLQNKIKIINIGLRSFHDSLKEAGEDVVHVDWKPPAAPIPPRVAAAADRIDRANRIALERILASKPVLVGLGIARETIPGYKANMILHSGPPIEWDRMCGPMRGAVSGALIYEGLAATIDEAEKLCVSGAVEFSPCHHYSCVGPMAGVVSASMPVFILENKTYGNRGYCTLNEGLGKVLRYGAYGDDVIRRLKWMETVLYPVLRDAMMYLKEIDLKAIISQAMHMGDELHNRNRAATSLLFRRLAPAIVRTCSNLEDAAKSLEFINGNDHFFLNLSMPASKVCLDAARNIPNSSIVTVMARNGTDFGIQVSGMGDEWFTGPAPVPDALYFPGYTKEDANPDIGDSAITETYGLGGFAIAAAPAIVQFVGGSAADALNYTLAMYEITVGKNEAYQIPNLDFRGAPVGIDVRKVIEKNITPFIDTGVAHKKPGIGQVGAGVLSAPIEPFKKAMARFGENPACGLYAAAG